MEYPFIFIYVMFQIWDYGAIHIAIFPISGEPWFVIDDPEYKWRVLLEARNYALSLCGNV